MRKLAIGVVAVLAVLVPAGAAQAKTAKPPQHVFVIVLENEDADTTFGPASPAPYLAADAHARRARSCPATTASATTRSTNYIAMVSGQAPNPRRRPTARSSPTSCRARRPPTARSSGRAASIPRACRPSPTSSRRSGLSWKGYMEDMGADPARDDGTTCAHPAIGTPDRTQQASADRPVRDAAQPVRLLPLDHRPPPPARSATSPLDRLDGATSRRSRTTPNLSFITPDLCHDGHDATCADGGPGGLPAARRVPARRGSRGSRRSPAYRQDGLLVVTFDEAERATRAPAAASSPGRTPRRPAARPAARAAGAPARSCSRPPSRRARRSTSDYNHYSLLRSIEDLFGLAAPRLRGRGRPAAVRLGHLHGPVRLSPR